MIDGGIHHDEQVQIAKAWCNENKSKIIALEDQVIEGLVTVRQEKFEIDPCDHFQKNQSE